MTQPEQDTPARPWWRLDIELVDVVLVAGVGMVFAGLWLVRGLGLALLATGGLVVVLALFVVLFPVLMEARANRPPQPTPAQKGG